MSELDAYLDVCTDLALVGGVSSIRDYIVSRRLNSPLKF